MGIASFTRYWVSCDVPGCCETSEGDDPRESERSAEAEARNIGFTCTREGKWLCEEHSPRDDEEEDDHG